jgi:hypothetical protein
MKVRSNREFQNDLGGLLRSKYPVVVTRRGKLAGVFFPCLDESLPRGVKRELFAIISSDIAGRLRKSGVREQDILRDFQLWRANKRKKAGRCP